MTEGGTGETERQQPTGALTNWRQQREGLVRTWKETDQLRRTHNLETAEGWLVGTWKETDQPRYTHQLETGGGGTCQDMERNQLTKAHMLKMAEGGTWSGHGKKLTEQGALTS